MRPSAPIRRFLALIPAALLALACASCGDSTQPRPSGTWRQSAGPTGARVTALAIAPDGTLYAGTDLAGVFASRSRGASWSPAGPMRLPGIDGPAPVLALAVTPRGTLLAGTRDGVYRSVNGGSTWTLSDSRSGEYPVGDAVSLAVDAAGRVFAGMYSGDIYRSLDEGATWARMATVFGSDAPSLPPSVVGIAITSAGDIYAASSGFSVQRSSDHGDTWAMVDLGITNRGLHAVVASGTSDVYLATGTVVLHLSPGDAWEPTGGVPGDGSVLCLAADAQGRVYAGEPGGLYRTDDHGATWNPVQLPAWSGAVNAVAFAAAGTGIAGTDVGVFAGQAGSSAWAPSMQGFVGTTVNALAVTADGSLLAAAQGVLARSADRGATWTVTGAGLPATAWRLAVARSGVAFALTSEGVYRSTDNGGTRTSSWARMPDPSGVYGAYAVTAAPDGKVFLGTSGGLLRSADDGASWVRIGPNPPDGFALAFAVGDSGEVYAGANDWLRRSSDDGDTWTLVPLAAAIRGVGLLEVRPGGVLFATDAAGHLWSTPDRGATWSRVASALADVAPYTVYALSRTRVVATGAEGVYVSTDGGTNWRLTDGGLSVHDVPGAVECLALDASGRLYAGTWHAGVYYSDIFAGSGVTRPLPGARSRALPPRGRVAGREAIP